MNKTKLIEIIDNAKKAEENQNFINASAFYKEALELAVKLQDSKSIKICKNKIVEMNKRSIESGKDFREVETSIQLTKEEQNAFNKIVESIIGIENINDTLKVIGQSPYFCPDVQTVEKQTSSTMPITYQVASLSTISDSGHNLRGGSKGNYSWFIQMYGIHQRSIMDMYINRIFFMLIKDKKLSLQNLDEYFTNSELFNSDQLKIIHVGLERYFKEDYVSALHILVPQFESFFLEIAKKFGINIVAIDNKMDIATRTIILSENHLDSDEFKKIFGENFCRQVRFILFEPMGYKIRHKIAHGEIKSSECNFSNTTLIIYLYLVLLGRIVVKKKGKD